jgi:soluble lytic murein transglycosylase-like protein
MTAPPPRLGPRTPRCTAARAAAVLALLAAFAAPAGAELVVFEDGGWLKVDSYEVRGDRVRIGLAGGGVMTVDLARVERVVDDEVIRPAAVAAVEAPAPAEGPQWRFASGGAAPATPFSAEIFQAAERHGLDPALIAAVVRAESAFDPRAVSHKGARGLMQLMPATAGRFGLAIDEIHDPAKNLDAGARYLAWLIQRFGGDVLRALAAYNAGEGTVDRYGGVPPYRETRNYIRRIYTTLGFAT